MHGLIPQTDSSVTRKTVDHNSGCWFSIKGVVLSRPQWLKVAPTCCSHRGECQHMCEHRMFRECLSQELRASQEGHSVGRASLGQGLPWSLRGTYIAYFCVHSLASLFYMGLAWAGRCPWEPGQLHTKPTLRGRILRSVGLNLQFWQDSSAGTQKWSTVPATCLPKQHEEQLLIPNEFSSSSLSDGSSKDFSQVLSLLSIQRLDNKC